MNQAPLKHPGDWARNCPPHELLMAVAAGGNDAAVVAARRLDCPTGLLTELAERPASRRVALANPHCPVGMLESASFDKDNAVRFAVAGNPSTPPAAIERLAEDPNVRVATEALSNSAATPSAVEKAANFLDDRRVAAAMSAAITTYAADRLVHVDDQQVRAALARNRHVSGSVLTELAVGAAVRFRNTGDRQEAIIRGTALGNPNCPADAVCVVLARLDEMNDVTDDAEAERAAKSIVGTVNDGVSNPNLTPDALMVAVTYAEQLLPYYPRAEGCLERAAGHPSAPAELVARLARKANVSDDVREAARRNPKWEETL